ncbi:MAG: T9SS type A sorting domain-containing protein [Bacteroidia bacterium]|nr:T9SS type A sorting domain-containing protein [Bacteroidia bacterium]
MKIYIIILFLFLASLTRAQVIDFERVHPLGIGWYCIGADIVQISDSEYIGVGFSDASYPFPDTLNFSGYAIAYYSMIFKINSQGDSLFIRNLDLGTQNFFNLNGYYPLNGFNSVAKISNNSYIATGVTMSILPLQNQYDVDCIFHKFDSNGDSLSTTAISIPDSQFYGISLIKTSDNYVMGVGFHVGYVFGQLGRGDIMKLDTMGNLIWHKVYNSPSDMHFSGITECPDGGFIIAARTYNGTWANGNNYNPVMMKIDSSGNVVWQKVFPTLQYSFLQGPSVTRTSDDNYIFSYPDYHVAPKHFKLNENGDTLWKRSINIYQQEGLSLQATFSASDNYGGIVAIATTTDSISTDRGSIYRLSWDGNLLWNRNFGTSFSTVHVHSVKQTSDNGFIVTGGSWCCSHEWPNGGNLASLYVIKFDSLGLLYPIGIEEPLLRQSHLGTVYPNPCSEQITVSVLVPPGGISSSMKGEPGARLLVFDIRGAQVQEHKLQTGLNSLTIDVSTLASGEYLCVLSLDGYNAGGKRFVVAH